MEIQNLFHVSDEQISMNEFDTYSFSANGALSHTERLSTNSCAMLSNSARVIKQSGCSSITSVMTRCFFEKKRKSKNRL